MSDAVPETPEELRARSERELEKVLSYRLIPGGLRQWVDGIHKLVTDMSDAELEHWSRFAPPIGVTAEMSDKAAIDPEVLRQEIINAMDYISRIPLMLWSNYRRDVLAIRGAAALWTVDQLNQVGAFMPATTQGVTMVSEAEKKDVAAKLGIDLTKIDWNAVFQMVLALIAIFTQQPVPPAKTAVVGCPDDCEEMAKCHLEAIQKAGCALEASICSFQCCAACMCPPKP